MKNLIGLFLGIISLIGIYSCQPISSIQIETLVPSEVNFPADFNKVMFINLDNDINNDNEIDTVVFKLINKEMALGFLDGMYQIPNIDSSRFFINTSFVENENIYKKDINEINWQFFDVLLGKYNTDLFLIIDSLDLVMNEWEESDYSIYPYEFYKVREFSIKVYWKFLDVIERQILDSYVYSDTLYWDIMKTDKNELDNALPTTLETLKEICYYAALDYSKRIFPSWYTENRYVFIDGNKQFRNAAQLINDGKWEDAMKIWKQNVKGNDKEISSRASYNLAVAYEILGKIDLAIEWAQVSYDFKEKRRTKYYILKLKKRKADFQKLKYQL